MSSDALIPPTPIDFDDLRAVELADAGRGIDPTPVGGGGGATIDAEDPGALGAGALWESPGGTLRVRNEADDDWLPAVYPEVMTGRAAVYGGEWAASTSPAGLVVHVGGALYQARETNADDPQSDPGQLTWDVVEWPIWLTSSVEDPTTFVGVFFLQGSLYTSYANASTFWVHDGTEWLQVAVGELTTLTKTHADGIDSVVLSGNDINIERQDDDGVVRTTINIADGTISAHASTALGQTRVQIIADASDAIYLQWLDTDGVTNLASIGLSGAGIEVNTPGAFTYNGDEVAVVP